MGNIWILKAPYNMYNSINISIAAGKGTPVTLNWKDDIANEIEENSNFSDYTAEQLDAEYFYQHFGSLRFLNALYAAFNNDNGEASETYDNLTISGYTKAKGIELGGEDSSKTLALTVDFGDGYRYYRGSDSYQTISGKVTFTFTGTVEENGFKATSFTVKADSTLNLSDSSSTNKRPDATATLPATASGKFGDGESNNGHIIFTLNDKTAVTGITNYKDSYNDDNNEFVLTAEGGITSIAITLK